MAAPLKKHVIEEKVVPLNKQEPVFQEYKALDTNAIKYQDLIFFSRIVSFAICTVLSCFVFLTANMAPLLAFPLGMALGALSTVVLSFLMTLLTH